MMNNKYYEEIKSNINIFLKSKKYEEALKLINEELSMPYIPMKFEEFLISKLKQIPLNGADAENNLSFNLERIIDLLIYLDNSNDKFIDLINQLNKFNLKNYKEEIDFYFSKSKNIQYRLYVFDILCKQKVDIELEYGNPSRIKSILQNDKFINDKNIIIKKLEKYPTLLEPALSLLKDIYIPYYATKEIEGNYQNIIIYVLSSLFNQKELLKIIDEDLDLLKIKLEKLKYFNNL